MKKWAYIFLGFLLLVVLISFIRYNKWVERDIEIVRSNIYWKCIENVEKKYVNDTIFLCKTNLIQRESSNVWDSVINDDNIKNIDLISSKITTEIEYLKLKQSLDSEKIQQLSLELKNIIEKTSCLEEGVFKILKDKKYSESEQCLNVYIKK